MTLSLGPRVRRRALVSQRSRRLLPIASQRPRRRYRARGGGRPGVHVRGNPIHGSAVLGRVVPTRATQALFSSGEIGPRVTHRFGGAVVVRATGCYRTPVELELHELLEQDVECTRVRLDRHTCARVLCNRDELGEAAAARQVGRHVDFAAYVADSHVFAQPWHELERVDCGEHVLH